MWAKAFVQSFIEVLPLISAFLMQFKIKEMKGKAVCEWLYKQDSRGVLISQFCKRLWAAFPRKGEGRGLARVAVEEGAGRHWAGADPAWICERVGRAGGAEEGELKTTWENSSVRWQGVAHSLQGLWLSCLRRGFMCAWSCCLLWPGPGAFVSTSTPAAAKHPPEPGSQ